ncbi:DUF1232 domain-containing protein [Myxococcota bacterium]|nr:DUF1232 domain-containing protein [Myxococcota bacterium]MBU1413132.1 DUF1232 domain-containing protein [Myxococcota bacterium]MBU1511098.1 DUF1232 domain-containing protein [Myxococcota bacterium]PKN26080.1 MAG: hypothetical protein CVU65_06750 [Deltaproteobacteria bacterium HGW-Deltaproteobacteria-22]
MDKTKEYANHFQKWIDNYADDTRIIMAVAQDSALPAEFRRLAIGTLNYNLKQLDLIPDFYTPVGLIDDAMIIRVFARLTLDDAIQMSDDRIKRRIVQMAEEDAVLQEFCGEVLYNALVKYVKAQPDRKVRQRDAKIVMENPSIMKEFMDDLELEIRGYEGSLIENHEEVIKDLKSFLKLKLVG